MIANTPAPEDSPLEIFTLALTFAKDPKLGGKEVSHLEKRLHSTANQACAVLGGASAKALYATTEAIHLAYLMKSLPGLKEQVEGLRKGPIDPEVAEEVLAILGEAA